MTGPGNPGGAGNARLLAGPRRRHMMVLYGILVALMVISGLLFAGGQAGYALVVLAAATLLNIRIFAFRRRLERRDTGGPR